jgi:hypothetical protein
MADFDDLRNLTDDDFSFDDFDEDDVDFDNLGKTIGEEDDDEWDDTETDIDIAIDAVTESAAFAQVQAVVFSINSLERMLLSVMLFANVLVVGLALLMITGRLG